MVDNLPLVTYFQVKREYSATMVSATKILCIVSIVLLSTFLCVSAKKNSGKNAAVLEEDAQPAEDQVLGRKCTI